MACSVSFQSTEKYIQEESFQYFSYFNKKFISLQNKA